LLFLQGFTLDSFLCEWNTPHKPLPGSLGPFL
jgi:hypothetical protein